MKVLKYLEHMNSLEKFGNSSWHEKGILILRLKCLSPSCVVKVLLVKPLFEHVQKSHKQDTAGCLSFLTLTEQIKKSHLANLTTKTAY